MGATRRAALVLVAPFIVIAGIVGGLFTCTSRSGIACVPYALVLGFFAIFTGRSHSGTCRPSSGPDGPDHRSGDVCSRHRVRVLLDPRAGGCPGPVRAASHSSSPDPSRPWVILIALNVLLLILGCLMDSLAILLIITPMILPIANTRRHRSRAPRCRHGGESLDWADHAAVRIGHVRDVRHRQGVDPRLQPRGAAVHRHPDRQAAGTANEGHSGDYESPPWPCQWFQKS